MENQHMPSASNDSMIDQLSEFSLSSAVEGPSNEYSDNADSISISSGDIEDIIDTSMLDLDPFGTDSHTDDQVQNLHTHTHISSACFSLTREHGDLTINQATHSQDQFTPGSSSLVAVASDETTYLSQSQHHESYSFSLLSSKTTHNAGDSISGPFLFGPPECSCIVQHSGSIRCTSDETSRFQDVSNIPSHEILSPNHLRGVVAGPSVRLPPTPVTPHSTLNTLPSNASDSDSFAGQFEEARTVQPYQTVYQHLHGHHPTFPNVDSAAIPLSRFHYYPPLEIDTSASSPSDPYGNSPTSMSESTSTSSEPVDMVEQSSPSSSGQSSSEDDDNTYQEGKRSLRSRASVRPLASRTRSKRDKKPAPRIISLTIGARSEQDQFLLDCRIKGMSYRAIKKAGRFTEAESTLRGRVRALTKPRSERLRSPQWQKKDVELLKKAMKVVARIDFDQVQHDDWLPERVPWAKISAWVHAHSSSYKFAPSACSKKWKELLKGSDIYMANQ